MFDRREKPSHGYRAVHVVVEIDGKVVEIQVRTTLQHLWAELSEKLADVLDPAFKYGGGADAWREILVASLEIAASLEADEKRFAELAALEREAENIGKERKTELLKPWARFKRLILLLTGGRPSLLAVHEKTIQQGDDRRKQRHELGRCHKELRGRLTATLMLAITRLDDHKRRSK